MKLHRYLNEGTPFYFVRHSLTAKAADGQADIHRPLSQEGVKLAKKVASRHKFIEDLQWVFTNPAILCQETARTLTELSGSPNRAVIPMAYVVDPRSPGHEAIEAAYRKVGNAPLAVYDAEPGCTGALTLHANVVLAEMDQCLMDEVFTLDDIRYVSDGIMLVTHGTTAVAIARYLARMLDFRVGEVEKLNYFLPTECSMIEVSRNNGVVCHSPAD